MPVSLVCTICGQLLPEPVLTSGGGATEAVEDNSIVRTCASCRSKIGSSAIDPINRTTIMRPTASFHLDEQPPLVVSIDGQKPQTPSGRNIDSSRSADSEVALVQREFGSYEILCEINRGSFGVVYKARQHGLDRVVALKVLLAGVHASPEAVARFQREARSVARLKHPNIVPIYDIGTYNGHHYFAMEFVEGKPLSTLIAEKSITTFEALTFAEAIADALQSAHDAGVIHRDVKPSNILVNTQRRPHITDFGLAKQIDLDTKYTLSGTTLGTPAYMPPEQAKGDVEKIDARSDVYAIGAVLYEMLTGQTPFGGRSLLEVVVAVINEPVTPPRQINPKIHRDIQTIVMKCLEKNPAQRYQSAGELRDDIARFRAGEAIRAKPVGMLRLSGRILQRHSTLLTSVAVVMVIGWYSYFRVQKARQEAVTAETKLFQTKQEVELKKQAVWRPDWWYPPRSPEDADTEYSRLVPGKDHVWDLQNDKTVKIPGTQQWVSPEEARFYGDRDLDANIVFNLTEAGTSKCIRIGLQSVVTGKGFDGVPYLLEIRTGNLRLIGPSDLFGYSNSLESGATKDDHKTPALEVKAEKYAPELSAGQYTLNIHREGTYLLFRLTGPTHFFDASIQIKDLNLSNWIFKNTQLVFRTPLPESEFKIVSAEVRRKYGGEEEKALSYFPVGEYNVAENELKVLAEGTEHLKRAMALYQLGLIQEISTPNKGRDLGLYTDALSQLDQSAREDPQNLERSKLAKELRLRRMVCFARNKQWGAMLNELNRTLVYGESIGEPFAWELQSVLEMALRDPDKPSDQDKARDPEKPSGIQAALLLFEHLGLRPGGKRLDKSALELALLISAENRFSDLITLHRAYPTSALADAFFDAINRALKLERIDDAMAVLQYITPFQRHDQGLKKVTKAGGDVLTACLKAGRIADAAKLFKLIPGKSLVLSLCGEIIKSPKDFAGQNFEDFINILLPAVVYELPRNDSANPKLGEAVQKIAESLVAHAKYTELVKLHEALRGPRVKQDARMTNVFADAIRGLAAEGAPERAIDLLKYCANHVGLGVPEIQKSALTIAERTAVVDENSSYAIIHRIQHTYPSPQLVELAGRIMKQLNQNSRYAETVFFFIQARVEFQADARVLMSKTVAALENIRSQDQSALLLASLWEQVDNDLKQDDTEERTWRLDFGDIALGLNQWDQARESYYALYTMPNAEPELKAKAGLRLAAMAFVRPGITSPTELLLPVLSLEKAPDELKQVSRLLASPDQVKLEEIENHRKEHKEKHVASLLTDGEWALVRGLRLRMDGSLNEARSAFAEALRISENSDVAPIWPRSVASQLLRPASRSFDDDPKSAEEKLEKPKLVPRGD